MASASGSSGEPKSKPFRFKARSQEDSESGLPPRKRHRRFCSHRHHENRHHHHSRRRPDPAPATPPLSPDAAFRESLFDALADEEGAAFWEGVYGQPIHTYSRYAQRTAGGAAAADDPTDDGVTYPDSTPVLERMSDEEYAAYVRARMWERSREAVEMERAKRAKEKAERRRRAESKAHEQQASEERRQSERRRKEREWRKEYDQREEDQAREEREKEPRAAWDHESDRDREWPSPQLIRTERGRWDAYLQRWRELSRSVGHAEPMSERPVDRDNTAKTKHGASKLRMPWPIVSGRAADVAPLAVERFLRIGAASMATSQETRSEELVRLVKSERVRWHPDRMTRLDLDDLTTKEVTAVFQIIDQFWQQLKDSSGGHQG